MPDARTRARATLSSGDWRDGNKANRAKQFAPFAALTGYYDLVRASERLESPRHEHTEEDIESISAVLQRITKGCLVRLTFYDTDAYLTTTGMVSDIDTAYQRLRVIKRWISFEDILEIEITD